MSKRLEQLAARLDAVKIEGGPIGTVAEAIRTLMDEATQGCGQSCATKGDSIWTKHELGLFVRGLTPLVQLLEENQ